MIVVRTGVVSRFVSENERGQSDINTVSSTHVETVCLLSNRKSKPDTHVDLTLDMEDYYRIKDQEKTVK